MGGWFLFTKCKSILIRLLKLWIDIYNLNEDLSLQFIIVDYKFHWLIDVTNSNVVVYYKYHWLTDVKPIVTLIYLLVICLILAQVIQIVKLEKL